MTLWITKFQLIFFFSIFTGANFLSASDEIGCNISNLTIKTSTKLLKYHVEVADTPYKRHKGLMNRKNLPFDHGMLLVFDSPQYGRIWMKNTSIVLC